MAGLAIVVCAALYLWLAHRVVRSLAPLWAKAIALMIALAIPTTDAILGRINLRQLCRDEGGLKVFRTVATPGFLSDSLTETILRKYPYTFVEARQLSGSGYVRYSKSADGQITTQLVENTQSRYEHRTTPADLTSPYSKTTFEVFTRDTHEVLGRVTDFKYAGGWVERLMGRLIAARPNAGTCELGPYIVIDEQLITSTLTPSQ
jgi:hypothetical protein